LREGASVGQTYVMTNRPHYLQFDATTSRVNIDPHSPEFYQDPYAAYAFLHEACPAFYWEEFGIWCFAGFDDVNRLLRDRTLGRENPDGPPAPQNPDQPRGHIAAFDGVEAHSLLEREPPVHTRLRTLINRAFVSRQVERLRPQIEALANRLIDGFEHQGTVDLLPAFATPIPVMIIADMLGIDHAMGPKLLEWSHDMVAMYMHGRSQETEHKANKAALEFSNFIRSESRARIGTDRDDLLTLLAAAGADGQKLTEDELISTAILLLNAGHEATVHQLGNGVKSILQSGLNPAELFQSDASSVATVEECIRFDAPLHMFTRYLYQPLELANGTTIAAGQQVGLLLGAANCDPRSFAEPLQFNPDRTDQKNTSFGAGIHFCIGAPLARLEMQIAMKVLFNRLPKLRLAEPPRYRDSYHFHGLESLVLRWD
jgi:cytochrome P450